MFSSRVPTDLAPNRLAAALERLRSTGTSVVNLTESNPTRVSLMYPPGLLAPLADDRALRYEPHPLGLPAARDAVAGEFHRRGLDLEGDRIVLTASTSEAYACLFKLLCDPGESVLVPRPSYPLFEHLTRLDAVRAEAYDLEYDDTWSIDLDSVRRAATGRTRAILIVSPNNPTGSFLKEHELEALARLCCDRSLALVGDEVFVDYPLEPDAQRAASVLTQKEALTFGLGGLSKSVGLPQLKLGWMGVSGPRALVEPALERLELICDTYLSVSTPVQVAAPKLLAAGARIRVEIARRVATNYGQLVELARAHPSCRVLRAEGGWYAVVQVPPTQAEEALVLDLLERDRILVHPGYFFDFPREAFLVVSLLPPPDEFALAARRMFERVEAAASSTRP